MIRYLYLGRMAYDEALRLQAELVELRIEGRIDNTLLLLEHPPVLTLGRNANRSNVLVTDEMLAARGVTIHEIKRGGDVTYHGPGQLVGYPIFDLRSLRNAKGGRLGPVDFVRLMEEALIRFCGVYGVIAGRICGLTGVWYGLEGGKDCRKDEPQSQNARKIGAIGIHVSRGVVSHGFAFNITTDPLDFIECIPFSETRNYVQRVMENVLVYRARFEGSGAVAGKTDQRVVTQELNATAPVAAAAPAP